MDIPCKKCYAMLHKFIIFLMIDNVSKFYDYTPGCDPLKIFLQLNIAEHCTNIRDSEATTCNVIKILYGITWEVHLFTPFI